MIFSWPSGSEASWSSASTLHSQVSAAHKGHEPSKPHATAVPTVSSLNLAPNYHNMLHLCTLPTVLGLACAAHAEELRGEEKRLPLPWSCTEATLMGLIRARDPSGRGLRSMLALRLLMLLLHWNPAMRPTPQQVRKDSLAFALYHSHSAGCSGVCCPLQIAMRSRNG